MANANLTNAKKAKNDEFYTQLTDIEKEMRHYKDFFKGKVVYCNCDDARESNFFKYFSLNFEHLGLKKLISTGFKADGKGVVLIYEGDKNGNRIVDDNEIIVNELEGNGDFRSAECIEFLKEADVVVTNPPFSLFREYVAQLMEYGKKFLIIGNLNAVGWKETFPYIKNNMLWWGYNSISSFNTQNGVGKVACRWYTNIGHQKRNTELDLYRKYDSDAYIKYENYNAIDCPKVSDIPIDYDGVVGVPISFLDTYCPNQFDIIGVNNDTNTLKELGVKPIGVKGIELMKLQGGTAHLTPNSVELYFIENGKFKKPFARLLIRKKNLVSCWFTNIEHKKRNEELDLYRTYNENDYPHYDNYNAINVDKVKDIPMDYEGVMGVPITFLDKYCPSQFEIVGGFNGPTINKKSIYYRILIKRR